MEFIEKKNPHVSGPMQLKPVLFKGQLYMLCDLVKKKKSKLKPLKPMVFQALPLAVYQSLPRNTQAPIVLGDQFSDPHLPIVHVRLIFLRKHRFLPYKRKYIFPHFCRV